jgi:hypothetical protein
MDDEALELTTLLDACHRILPKLADDSGELAQAIRETCRLTQERLDELGIPWMKAEAAG